MFLCQSRWCTQESVRSTEERRKEAPFSSCHSVLDVGDTVKSLRSPTEMCEYVCVQNTGHLSLCGGARKCLKIWALEVESPLVVIGHHVLICAPGSCRRSSGPQLEETMVSLHHPNPSQHQITHYKTHMSQKECICFLLSAFDEECMRKIPARESNTCLRICQKSGQKSKDNPPTLRQISVRWMTSTMPSIFWLICLHCKVLCISTRMLLHMQNNKHLWHAVSR